MIMSYKPDVKTKHAYRSFKLNLFILVLFVSILSSFIPSQNVFANEGYTASLFLDVYPEKESYLRDCPMVILDGKLYFIADNDEDGRILWQSDGTPQGTVMVENSAIAHLVEEGTPYYFVEHGNEIVELWKYNGTSPDPVMLKRIERSGDQSHQWHPAYKNKFATLNGETYFTIRYDDIRTELWKTNGTPEGTVLVEDLYTQENPPAFTYAYSSKPYKVNDSILLLGDQSGDGDIWRSSGTPDTTNVVTELDLHDRRIVNNCNIRDGIFYASENALYIPLGDQSDDPYNVSGNVDIWKTDGTQEGTKMVTTIEDPEGLMSVCYQYPMKVVNNTFYFREKNQLYKLDRNDTKVLVQDFVPHYGDGAFDSFDVHLFDVDGTLYFTTKGPNEGVLLWTSDGTPEGTRVLGNMGDFEYVKNIINFNGTLFFLGDRGLLGRELYKVNTAP